MSKAERSRSKLRRLIRRHVEAQIADSWKGGGDPDSIPEIEAEMLRAESLLNNHIATMRGPA